MSLAPRLILAWRVAAVMAALALALACSSTSGVPVPMDAGDAGSNDADAHVEEAGADRASPGPLDAGCFAAVGSAGPDAAGAQIYGSCVPHVAEAGIPTCYESGHVGDVPDSGGMPSSLEATCTSAPLDGTWSTRPCDRTGVVFGCQSVTLIGDVCAAVTNTWYYPPATGTDEQEDCPSPFVVVGP